MNQLRKLLVQFKKLSIEINSAEFGKVGPFSKGNPCTEETISEVSEIFIKKCIGRVPLEILGFF